MKKRILMLILIVFMLPLAACGDNVVTRLSVSEAQVMINGLEDVFLLDVRSYSEFRQSRIEGAVHIPYNEIAHRYADILHDIGAVIIVYCQSGRRSAIAGRALADIGFIRIYDMQGGINAWQGSTISD